MGILTHDQLALIFGLLGTTISFFVFLAPIPTFYTIWKKKSSEGYQSIPYVIALESAMLLLYYGFLKTNAYIIITINAIGCVIEISYLALYLLYAPKKEKRNTVKMVLFNVVGFGIMILLTLVLVKGSQRVTAVGWICAAFNLAVFAAPLSIMRQVINTKSVEFMPFTLSFFLTLCATAWFFYGFFVKDMYIAVPNVLGFLFGIAQMILYMIYKDGNKKDFDIEKAKHQDGFTITTDASHDQNPNYGDGSHKVRKRSIDLGDHEPKSVEMFHGKYRSIKSDDQNSH